MPESQIKRVTIVCKQLSLSDFSIWLIFNFQTMQFLSIHNQASFIIGRSQYYYSVGPIKQACRFSSCMIPHVLLTIYRALLLTAGSAHPVSCGFVWFESESLPFKRPELNCILFFQFSNVCTLVTVGLYINVKYQTRMPNCTQSSILGCSDRFYFQQKHVNKLICICGQESICVMCMHVLCVCLVNISYSPVCSPWFQMLCCIVCIIAEHFY